MPAYIVADITVTDPQRIEGYRTLSTQAVEAHGGRFVARGGDMVVLEGDWSPKRLVIIEFPDLDTAKRFYDSADYAEARTARENAAIFRMVAIAGL